MSRVGVFGGASAGFVSAADRARLLATTEVDEAVRLIVGPA